MYFCVTHIQVAIKKVIGTFSNEIAIFNNKRFNTFEYFSFYSLGLIKLHMKSAKHVKMNRASFASQHFFKGPHQIGETELLSRVNFGRKLYLKYTMLSCYIF